MLKDRLVAELQTTHQFFLTSMSCLTEADSTYSPKKKEMFTVAQQVMHVAQTVNWFIDGAFGPNGFDLNFDRHLTETKECTSLAQAIEAFTQATENAIETIRHMSETELTQPLSEGPIMAGVPKMAVISSISEHTAHHRGALTVYSRLLGKVPPMPYGEV